MSTFDIRDIEPEGYEIVAYGPPTKGEMFLSDSGEVMLANFNFEANKKLILRKKWTPKVGEVIAVRDCGHEGWGFRRFKHSGIHGGAVCLTVNGDTSYTWSQFRKQTPEERGE